ncbi:MAG: haloacid dehalogenase type II [Dehalococcoidia bacterium]
MPRYEVVSFDCYGTLIDWEKGMREALAALLNKKGLPLSIEALHNAYGEAELETEQGAYRSYKEVLETGVREAFRREGIELTDDEGRIFVDTIPSWPKFPETTEVLAQLKAKGYKLVILSNVDDDLIQGSVLTIGIDFDGVITAEQVRSYKPSPGHWDRMLKQFSVSKERVLHVGASYTHDITPGKELGFTVAWINRTGEASGGDARSDHQFPDLRGLLDIL